MGRLLARNVARRSNALLKAALAGWQAMTAVRRAFRQRLTSMAERANTNLLQTTFAGWVDTHAVHYKQQVRSSTS